MQFMTVRWNLVFTQNEALSMVSPPKRPSDGAFGSYFNTECNDMLFTRGRHTKHAYLSPKGLERYFVRSIEAIAPLPLV